MKMIMITPEDRYQIINGINVMFLMGATIYMYGVFLFEYKLITLGQATFYKDALSELEFYTIVPALIGFLFINLYIKGKRLLSWTISEYRKWLRTKK